MFSTSPTMSFLYCSTSVTDPVPRDFSFDTSVTDPVARDFSFDSRSRRCTSRKLKPSVSATSLTAGNLSPLNGVRESSRSVYRRDQVGLFDWCTGARVKLSRRRQGTHGRILIPPRGRPGLGTSNLVFADRTSPFKTEKGLFREHHLGGGETRQTMAAGIDLAPA
jgi:hypothetical protein